MPTRFTKVVKPTESREELLAGVLNTATNMTCEELVRYLLTFFTNVDLKLILTQMQENQNAPGLGILTPKDDA